MTDDKRKEHLEKIRKHAEKMRDVADGYAKLAAYAEMPDATLPFLVVVETAGQVTCQKISQAGDFLELMTILSWGPDRDPRAEPTAAEFSYTDQPGLSKHG